VLAGVSGGDGFENAAHEGGFAGAGNSGEDGESLDGDADVDGFEVAEMGTFDGEPGRGGGG